MNYSITPRQLLTDRNIHFRTRGEWLSIKLCPSCKGGDSSDFYTFAVHRQSGNFGCLRSTCETKGNFWDLFILFGLNPRDFYNQTETKKKRFVYGR